METRGRKADRDGRKEREHNASPLRPQPPASMGASRDHILYSVTAGTKYTLVICISGHISYRVLKIECYSRGCWSDGKFRINQRK